jgi:hypothetical protein
VVEQLKQLAIQNNTSGASIYDLGNIMMADSLPDITQTLKQIENKQESIRQQQMQQEQQMQQQAIEAKAEENRQKMEFEAAENEKNRQSRILEAKIKSAGYGATVDINQNQQSDYMDAMKEINRTQAQTANVDLQREKEINRISEHQDKMGVEQEKLNTQRDIAQIQLQIARENKNKFDQKGKETKKKK